jgi:hypothetical protein
LFLQAALSFCFLAEITLGSLCRGLRVAGFYDVPGNLRSTQRNSLDLTCGSAALKGNLNQQKLFTHVLVADTRSNLRDRGAVCCVGDRID